MHMHGCESNVRPARSVVQEKAQVRERSRVTRIVAVTGWLLDVDERFENIGIGVEADASDFFIGGVLQNRKDRFEHAFLQMSEVIRVARDELVKIRPLFGNRGCCYWHKNISPLT